jgi:UDP-3-O-[3-hydroxymyristoyl] glucosamine N-acyltransferase
MEQDLSEVLGVELAVRGIERVSGFAQSGPDAVVYAVDEETLAQALASEAGLILAPLGSVSLQQRRILPVRHPKYAFALCGRLLGDTAQASIHPSAVVEGRVAAGTSIGANSVIEAGASIGRDCVLGANVTVHARVTVGDRCVIQSGAVLGGTGFGYVQGPDGRHLRFPQIGTLWIGDDVEIGAGTTIDRGALGETRIGSGTKIDNLCHIAHNCIVGRNVLMAAQVGMAGSCVIEDGAMLGGQVGLGERVTIGKGVILGGQGGVLPGKRIDGEGVVYWGTPAQPVREYLRDLARMRDRTRKK